MTRKNADGQTDSFLVGHTINVVKRILYPWQYLNWQSLTSVVILTQIAVIIVHVAK